MANFFAELKRRQMFRVAAAYAVVAWLILQVVNNVAPGLSLPNWAVTLVIVLLAAGFPIALLFCWIQHLAPAGDASTQAKTNKLDWILAGGLVAVMVLMLYQQLTPSRELGTAQQASLTPASSAQPPGGISVAVLPLVNLSDDRAQEFFSDGMTDEINAALAKVSGLRVVARTSVYEFKGQNRNVRDVGQALSATHIIEGSVRRAGDRVRITTQLVRSGDGLNLWSETFDRELNDIFAVQEEIARAIAGALRVPLGLQQGDTLVRNRTDDLESYQQYLRGKALVRARALADAASVLESVVARDPEFAPAWALLAQTYRLTPPYSPVVRNGSLEEARVAMQSAREKGEAAARKAIELDPGNATGYGALAMIRAPSGEWTAVEDLFQQALALDPNETDVLNDFSQVLTLIGRLKEAASVREKLKTLEPFVPIYNIITAEVMQVNGQGRASIPILEAIPSDVAGGYFRNMFLARAYAAAGRYVEAADTLLSITGNQVTRRSAEDAARLIRQAPAKAATPQELPAFLSELNFVYVYIGAPDRVWESPDRNLELRNLSTIGIRDLWLPEFAPLRKTERFKAFMRRAGLVDYWRERGWPDLCRPVGADDFVCD